MLQHSHFDLNAFGKCDKETLVYLARQAETAERYEDMCVILKKLIEEDSDLSVEERNLLSVAYKNVVGSRRASQRTISTELQAQNESKELLTKYREKIESELTFICNDVLNILKDYLLPKVSGKNDESEVFYLKMNGDYYRYLAEFRPDYGKDAETNYQKALEIARVHLYETHPTLLGLVLNYSVCQYEILKNPEKACKLAKQAFDDAIQKLDSLDDSSYKDSTLIMQLLRDNLTLWSSENDVDNVEEEEEPEQEQEEQDQEDVRVDNSEETNQKVGDEKVVNADESKVNDDDKE